MTLSISRYKDLGVGAFLEASPDALFITDTGGRIHLLNQSAEEMFGYDRAELVGKPIEVLVPEDHRPAHSAHRADYAQRPVAGFMGGRHSHSARRKNGSEFPVEVRLATINTANSTSFICAVRDVSTQRSAYEQLEEDLADAMEERRRLEAEIAQFAELSSHRETMTHLVIHDLRTPLGAVLSGLLTLKMMGEPNSQKREVLDICIGGGQELLRIINDLLEVHRLENKALPLDLGPVVVSNLIEDGLRTVHALAAEKDLHIECSVAEDLPELEADRKKLHRVLVNLLGNAIKFTPPGGAVRISANHPAQSGEVRVSVEDTGPGIPSDEFERIFEKFGQVAANKQDCRRSTGLGLTLCKLVVEEHGGKIWVDSEIGKGSIFTIVLPIKPQLPLNDAQAA